MYTSENNLILMTDAYKQTHYKMLPKGLTHQFSYIESRGVEDKGVAKETLFLGMQGFIKKLLEMPATKENLEEAQDFTNEVFGKKILNVDGWKHIIDKWGGYIPVKIKAVPEGTLVPCHNILVAVENTDAKVPWIVNHIETSLLRAIWYPTTVGTTSFAIKKLIRRYAHKTGGTLEIPFHLNDFGARGVSSGESAGIGGFAHLVNFLGSDTLEGIRYAMKYYNTGVCGFSVPASEHSATIVHPSEKEAYEHFMDEYPFGVISIVSDSYDLYNALDNIFGKELRAKILERDGKVVIRPDSGFPPQVMVQTLKLLDKHFGSTSNDGYKTLNSKVGIIYGDYIAYGMIDDICNSAMEAGYSTDSFVFGMGGRLLQQVHRDTYKFAMKTSAALIDGVWKNVSKHPIEGAEKNSKAGRLMLVKEGTTFNTRQYTPALDSINELQDVYENGKLLKDESLDTIRSRAEYYAIESNKYED